MGATTGERDGRDAVGSTAASRVEELLQTAKALLEQAEKSASDQRLIMRAGT